MCQGVCCFAFLLNVYDDDDIFMGDTHRHTQLSTFECWPRLTHLKHWLKYNDLNGPCITKQTNKQKKYQYESISG